MKTPIISLRSFSKPVIYKYRLLVLKTSQASFLKFSKSHSLVEHIKQRITNTLLRLKKSVLICGEKKKIITKK